MTKKEITAALDAAQTHLDALREAEMKIARQQSEDFLKRVNAYFKPLLDYHPGVYIDKQYSGVYFYKKAEDRDYGKELVSLSYNDWRKVLELNTYTTIVSTDWELERLMFVGDLAKVMGADREGIINLFTSEGPLKEERDEILKQTWALEKDVTEYNRQLRQIERIERIAQLQTEGLEFEETKILEAKWDWIIRGICKIRIVRLTASGDRLS